MPFNPNHIIKPAIVGAVFAGVVSIPHWLFGVPWHELPVPESLIAGVAFALAVRIILHANARYKAGAPERAARAAAEAARRAALSPEEREEEDQEAAERGRRNTMFDWTPPTRRFDFPHHHHYRGGRR